ncbi:hypothetical protein KDW_38680 [Dictyobacter vulcani]|uniref:MalT-like TPR region domain-containing protein n=1 Tax=Dictyobacter vulcani TaxID=2607529 RepID=A0A5J4KWX5_9CHLR|nr:hypothetical protein [Dictyobacter vulcani]GER89706.1 hypothetical protein KDW_38680 [Dictyobacter vulcani]
MIQNNARLAKDDVSAALKHTENARGPLKGSVYLLAAEVYSIYAESDEKLKTQCRKWQDKALNFLYKGKVEPDGSFLLFDLYAVHHERAKTQTRFALFHTNDDELVSQIRDMGHKKAHASSIKDAQSALTTARSQFGFGTPKKELNIAVTEARLHLIEGEFEESSRTAKHALQCAKAAHSQRGVSEIRRIYSMLHKVAPHNPHVCNLGVELGIY